MVERTAVPTYHISSCCTMAMSEKTMILGQSIIMVAVVVQTTAMVVPCVVVVVVVVSLPIGHLLPLHNMHPSSYPGANHMIKIHFLHDQQIKKMYNTSL